MTTDRLSDSSADKGKCFSYTYNLVIPHRNAAEYNMQHNRRGMAIIFNHLYFDTKLKLGIREGTEVDCARLERVFSELRFVVDVHHDFSFEQIKETIKMAATQNHENDDCIVIAILTHGSDGTLSARDVEYNLADLCVLLAPNKCPSLAAKPKLFFVQACRGILTDPGTTLTQTEGNSTMGYKIPLYADFMVAYSTVPGFVSWRNRNNGSCFVQNLCAELEANGKRLDLLTMMTFVCHRVAAEFEVHGKKQMPCITTMLTRNIFFRDT